MSSNKPLGDTEKTVLVGVLVLGFWLGIDALATRAEKKGTTTNTDEQPRSAAGRRSRVLRSRRRKGRTA